MVAKTQILEELSARAVLLPTLIEEGLGDSSCRDSRASSTTIWLRR
jgi:hypothetical protein